MKRRFFALLAVPALALGFALASPGTDEAHAYMPLSHSTVCAIAKSQSPSPTLGEMRGAQGRFMPTPRRLAATPGL
jgi:hypothetical protein